MAKKKADETPPPDAWPAKGQFSVITLKGTEAFRDWLAAERTGKLKPVASSPHG